MQPAAGMRPAQTPEVFRRNPIGFYARTPSALVWCASPTLCGVVVWGAPDERETAEITELLDGFEVLSPGFDTILDGRGVQRINPLALETLLGWARDRLPELTRRLRTRIGVIPEGLHGITLAGITPVLGGPGPDLIMPSARDAFRRILGEAGDSLWSEVETLAADARSVPTWLRELRGILDAQQGSIPLAEVARRLGMSTRTLQRNLASQGVSYRDEQHHARFRAADVLLASNEKIIAIAARLGLTEAGLNLLVRRRTGLTPGAYRRQLVRTSTAAHG